MIYKKLVRDKIPEMIVKEGYIPKTEILSDERYIRELDRKLIEEVKEYQKSKEIEELADILEVIYALCQARGYSTDDLIRINEEKRLRRGGFSKKVFLISKSKKK